MNPENEKNEPKAEPSDAPLKNEPTPERAAEEKKTVEDQAANIAKPKPSGAV
jgi:hypothetical protein